MNVIPTFMRFYNTETTENNEDKENFNPLIKQYSPIKNSIKKRNTILKEITDRNRKIICLENKNKVEESELGNLFSNMDSAIKKTRFGREM